MSKIKQKDYLKAKALVLEYQNQISKELVKPYTCSVCKTNEVTPSEDFPIDPNNLHKGNWENGDLTLLSPGYGSSHDMSQYYMAVCDECLSTLREEGIITNTNSISTTNIL
jgi:hypothetical protein